MKVIEMSMEKIIEDEFGAFEDEVLNAGWTPPQTEAMPATRNVTDKVATTANESDFDIDAFLSLVYCNQQ